MKQINIYLALVVFFLIGCTNQPKVPQYHINKNDKIGYVIQPSRKILHQHLGTTVFNNLKKTYDYNWHLEKDLEKILLKNIHVDLINLQKYNIKSTDIEGMIIEKDEKWVIAKNTLYQKLLQQLHLKAVIVISEKAAVAGQNYTVFKQSGIYSSNGLGLKEYRAVCAYSPDLYLLQPKAVIHIENEDDVKLIYNSVYDSYKKESGFEKPNDIDNLTRDELLPVKRSIIKQSINSIKKINRYLKR